MLKKNKMWKKHWVKGVLLKSIQGECWSKPTKYFKNVKVRVSPQNVFNSGGPRQSENCYIKTFGVATACFVCQTLL